MIYEFASNEATGWEVLEYLRRAYGTQISGAPFTIYNLNNWIRIKKLPEAYGGNKIIAAQRYKELGNLMVLTIDGWNRAEVAYLVGHLSDYEETKNHKRKQDTRAKSARPRKQRTRLYYEILDKAGKQYTKKTLK